MNKFDYNYITIYLWLLLSCFVDIEATYAEYEEWSEHGVPDTVTQQYKRAVQQMEKCKPFEEALVTGLDLSFIVSLLCNFWIT